MNYEQSHYYAAIIHGLAGVSPEVYWNDEAGVSDSGEYYDIRESMKRFATQLRNNTTPANRAISFAVHAYSHWWRASEQISYLTPTAHEEIFPNGMNFRRYLSAWLYSVGSGCLGMTAKDIELFYEVFGVAAESHPFLPFRRSEFDLITPDTAAIKDARLFSAEQLTTVEPTPEDWDNAVEIYLNSGTLIGKDDFTLAEIAEAALGLAAWHLRKPEQNRLANILDRLGWKRVLVSAGNDDDQNGVSIWKYRRPAKQEA